MTLPIWTKSNIEYTRKLVHSAVEGVQGGEEDFLHGEPLNEFVGSSIRSALRPAAIGTVLGILGGYSDRRRLTKALGYGILGGTLGFGVGFLWESRRMLMSIGNGARKKVDQVRDEHWLEKNPIDYA
jgi:hypothetical protein